LLEPSVEHLVCQFRALVSEDKALDLALQASDRRDIRKGLRKALSVEVGLDLDRRRDGAGADNGKIAFLIEISTDLVLVDDDDVELVADFSFILLH